MCFGKYYEYYEQHFSNIMLATGGSGQNTMRDFRITDGQRESLNDDRERRKEIEVVRLADGRMTRKQL